MRTGMKITSLCYRIICPTLRLPSLVKDIHQTINTANGNNILKIINIHTIYLPLLSSSLLVKKGQMSPTRTKNNLLFSFIQH